RFINLSKEKTKTFDLHGEVFQKMAIPEILVKSDAIITLPVLKMHIVTGMTFSLKNQWGCLTTVRQRYHLVADKCIPEINKFLNVAFAVGDATICMEGNGPVTGKPVRVDSVLASSDRVSLDSAGCEIMGVNPRKIGHIVHAEKIGLGNIDYKLKGDRLPRHRFRKPVLSQQPIVNIEFKLRKIPGVSWLVFDTPFFKLPAFAASRYNTVYWHNFHGRKLTKEFLDKNPLYREEFNELRLRTRSS
ncbi:DUF362 domain-containing protein, partial [Candidatus Pacearchaeota archaeon]|nr:DUF362 domain-containing protein [Candidatus Pacearchaeota archaeon]